MLPLPNDLMKMAGLEPEKIFPPMMDREGSITGKTVRNWFEGKSKPRPSTIRRFLESIVTIFDGDDLMDVTVEKIEQQVQETEGKEENVYFLAWGQFLNGIKLSAPSHNELVIGEAERLVELTRALKPYMENHDLKGLAKALSDSNIPKTDVTIKAIRLIEEANQLSDALIQKALFPIVLTNTLYLIACLDTKRELLTNLCPRFSEAKTVLPMGRWLDGIRETKNFSSDRKLGEFLLPNYDPEEARVEISKWRGGKIPSWKAVQKFPCKDREQVNTAFAIVNILQGIRYEMTGANSGELGFDAKSLFRTAPQLQALAKERAGMLSITT